VRGPPHDVKAAKQTVSLTINSDLYAQARRLGINASQIAEEALIQEVTRRKAESACRPRSARISRPPARTSPSTARSPKWCASTASTIDPRTAVAAGDLREPRGQLIAHRGAIVAALDYLVLGV
jgi:hypothetical protein